MRSMERDDQLLDRSAGLALGYVERPGLGRPALKLMTACLIATSVEPETRLAITAGTRMMSLLDDPQHVGAIKPYLRLESEAALIHTFGIRAARARRAIAASLMVIIADRNDGNRIPMRDKRDYVDYIMGASIAAGMPTIADKSRQVDQMLQMRMRVPRRKQAGSGVFFPLGD